MWHPALAANSSEGLIRHRAVCTGVGDPWSTPLSGSMVVQVGPQQGTYEQRFSRASRKVRFKRSVAAPNRRGTTVTFQCGRSRFSGSHAVQTRRGCSNPSARRPIGSRRGNPWKSAINDGETPQEAVFHFPGRACRKLLTNHGKASTLC